MTHPLIVRRSVEHALSQALDETPSGLLVLLESAVAVPALPPDLMAQVERTLGSGASLHVVSDELIALVCPGVSLFAGWSSVAAARQLFVDARVPLTVGLASWPMHGTTVTTMFGAAVVALAEDRERQQRSFLDDVDELFASDDEVTWSAGDLLSA